MNRLFFLLSALLFTIPAFAQVTVTSPVPNAIYSATVQFIASAVAPNCAKGVAAVGIYVDNKLEYVSSKTELNTFLTLSKGNHNVVVQDWDFCNGYAKTPLPISLVAPVAYPSNSVVFNQIQAAADWGAYGQQPPYYADCNGECPGETFSMIQHVSTPSLSGDATKWLLGGTQPYSDVLFNNHLIGPFSSQGQPDYAQSAITPLHNFVYDLDFYPVLSAHTGSYEFDINVFPGHEVGLTFGTQCRVFNGNEWDYWDNKTEHWVPTGIACNPVESGWNHVTLTVSRDAQNNLNYESIALNGHVFPLNKNSAPFSVPADWYGVTVNYQMDGDNKQTAVYSLTDNMKLRVW